MAARAAHVQLITGVMLESAVPEIPQSAKRSEMTDFLVPKCSHLVDMMSLRPLGPLEGSQQREMAKLSLHRSENNRSFTCFCCLPQVSVFASRKAVQHRQDYWLLYPDRVNESIPNTIKCV